MDINIKNISDDKFAPRPSWWQVVRKLPDRQTWHKALIFSYYRIVTTTMAKTTTRTTTKTTTRTTTKTTTKTTSKSTTRITPSPGKCLKTSKHFKIFVSGRLRLRGRCGTLPWHQAGNPRVLGSNPRPATFDPGFPKKLTTKWIAAKKKCAFTEINSQGLL